MFLVISPISSWSIQVWSLTAYFFLAFLGRHVLRTTPQKVVVQLVYDIVQKLLAVLLHSALENGSSNRSLQLFADTLVISESIETTLAALSDFFLMSLKTFLSSLTHHSVS